MATAFLFSLLIAYCVLIVQAQTISTTTPVPPLQWINLSNVLQGTNRPPPLRDAAIGYDETSRSLIIFGGLSQNGLAQSQTFLLNLQTLTWSIPSPPQTLQGAPPSRSAALFGCDFAASNRHGFIVIGGKGADGSALSDIWEYDFNNQFWSQVQLSSGGPSARWGASGGIDIRAIPNQDPIIPGPNNTFYLAGGFDGNAIKPLSDVWRLSVSGTLSSNLPNDVRGSWERLTFNNLPGRVNQAGTVVMNQIVASGGCNSSATLTATNTTCARQDSFIINTESLSAVSPGPCPAPRISSVFVPNLNTFDTSFASQTFMLLGGFNLSLWQDSDGHSQGEVAILDINTGSWTRVIPAGDLDSSGKETFPTLREGAAAFGFTEALVGDARNTASDTIIFGGQDANGIFSSDIWLLRAYSGVITPSNPTWAGFGDGQLHSGVNADGSGVKVQYLSECAALVPTATKSHAPTPTKTGSNPGNGDPGQSGPATSQPQNIQLFDASFAHKLLAPLSLVLFLPVILLFRWIRINGVAPWAPTVNRVAFVSLAAIIGLIAYGLGVAGFVLSFTTITSQSRSPHSQHLKTGHGIVGLVFFIGLYVFVPLIYIVIACLNQFSGVNGEAQSQRSGSGKANSIDLGEKSETSPLPLRSETPQSLRPLPPRSDTPLSFPNTSPPSSPRPRTLSWDASNMLRPSNDGGLSAESTISKGFEVVNRPNRVKNMPGPSHSTGLHGVSYPLPSTRSLGEIDWLLRRRSLNAVGELDYAITQAHNAQYATNNSGIVSSPTFTHPNISRPPLRRAILHTLTQLFIAGLAGVSLAQLWARAPKYLFVILLIILVAYYVTLVALAYDHRPPSSLLTMAIWRLRGNSVREEPNRPNSIPPTQGPYTHHRPSYRVATHPDELSYIQHASPLSADTDDNDDDIDEDTRQRAIEEEMDRREVSIVTVPRRKLAVVNPS